MISARHVVYRVGEVGMGVCGSRRESAWEEGMQTCF